MGGQTLRTKNLPASTVTDGDDPMRTSSTLDEREQVDEVVEEMEEREAKVQRLRRNSGRKPCVVDGHGEDAVGAEEVDEALHKLKRMRWVSSPVLERSTADFI
jgi:hypothetical protein